jgi:diguanylate cyclase (GGDEF)-like protein/PAS domain S-box-containing protein
MSVFALVSLFSCLVCVFLGSHVFYQNQRSLVNRTFALFCLAVAYWAFCEFMYRQTDNPTTARMWMDASSLNYLSLAFLVHFALTFTGSAQASKGTLLALLAYGPAVVFALINSTTSLINTKPIAEYWGYTYGVPEDRWWYWVSTAWGMGMGLLALFVMLRYYSKVGDRKRKAQARLVAIGVSAPIIGGVLSEGILPFAGIRIPEATAFALTFMVAFSAYAIWRYELFGVDAATAAENIIAAMAESLALINPDGRILRVNQSLHNLLEYEEQELIGQPMDVLFADRGFADRLVKGLLARETFMHSATEWKTKSGRGIEIELSASVIRTRSGEMAGAVVTATDVTDRKQAEAALRESERRIRTFLDSTSDMAYLKDGSFRHIIANRALCRFYGKTESEIIGKTDFDLMAEEAAAGCRKTDEQTLLSNALVITEEFVEGRYHETMKFPVELAENNRGIGAYIRDVSERKRADEALRESERRYRSLFDGIPIGLYRTSPQGQFLDANPALARMLGYPNREALRATNAADAYADARERERWLSALQAEAVVHDHEMEVLRPDGTVIWVQDKAQAILDPQGKVQHYEGSLQDISERKQAEDLLRSQSLKDDLTGLYNRRGFLALADQQMKLARRRKSGMTLLCFADLDGLKRINDALGHLEGDKALIAVAGILTGAFRESDIVARMGGDEFVVLALETGSDVGGALHARLENALNAYNAQAERGYTLSISVGVASYDPEHPCSIHELLAQADSLMYEQKRAKNETKAAGTG